MCYFRRIWGRVHVYSTACWHSTSWRDKHYLNTVHDIPLSKVQFANFSHWQTLKLTEQNSTLKNSKSISLFTKLSLDPTLLRFPSCQDLWGIPLPVSPPLLCLIGQGQSSHRLLQDWFPLASSVSPEQLAEPDQLKWITNAFITVTPMPCSWMFYGASGGFLPLLSQWEHNEPCNQMSQFYCALCGIFYRPSGTLWKSTVFF